MEECSAKDKEICELKEDVAKLSAAGRSITNETSNSILSPTLFSQNSSEFDFAVDDDVHMAPAQKMASSSSPIHANKSCKQEIENRQPRSASPGSSKKATTKSMKTKRNEPEGNSNLSRGWVTKGTRMSFTNLKDQTHIHSPKKSTKARKLKEELQAKNHQPNQRTIQDLFNLQAAAEVKIKAEPGTPIETIQLDEDEDTLFTTPIKRKASPSRKVEKVVKKSGDMRLDEFCDECRAYFETNPPQFLSEKDREKKIRECENHKKKKYKLHLTPTGFWQVGFGDTPPQMKTQIYTKKP